MTPAEVILSHAGLQSGARLPVNNTSRYKVRCEVKPAPKEEAVFIGMCETLAPPERAVFFFFF